MKPNRMIQIAYLLFTLLLMGVLNQRVTRGQQGTANRNAKVSNAVSGQKLVVTLGHTDAIACVAYSPNGRNVITGGVDKTAILWESETGREVRRFVGHSEMVTCLTFSPDGRHILTGSADKTVRVWESETGREVRHLVGHSEAITSIASSPDSQYVLTGSRDGIARLWEKQAGREIRRFEGHSHSISSVVFSPDGRHVLTGSADRTARLWDTTTGREVRRFAGHTARVHSVAFSPNGRYVLTGSEDKTALLWEAGTGREVRRIQDHTEPVMSVAFSSDGRYVLTGSEDKTARMWDVGTGREAKRFTGIRVYAVIGSPDGRYLLTLVTGGVQIWEIETEREVSRITGYSSTYNVDTVTFSPDGRYLMTAGTTGPVIWEIGTGKIRHIKEAVISTGFSSFALSPDGRYVVSTSILGAMLSEVESGKRIRRFVDHPSYPAVISVAFSPDGKQILVMGSQGMRLWEVDTGREVWRAGGNLFHAFSTVAFSPDGQYVLTGGWDTNEAARLWERKTGREVRRFTGDSDQLHSVSFSPDGQYVLTSGDPALLWEVRTGHKVKRFARQNEPVYSVAFSRDGRYVLTGSLTGAVRLWDVQTQREARYFEAHSTVVKSVAFSPDGKHVFTGSEDGTARVWDAATGKEVCTLVNLHGGSPSVVDPEGRFDASNIEDLSGLGWVISDEPLRAFPIEISMRDYFEPRLLPRLLTGEQLSPVRRLSDLNRQQPRLSSLQISAPDAVGMVTVSFEVASTASEKQHDRNGRSMASAVYDVRLFRDGQLVGYTTTESTAPTFDSINATDEKALAEWRRANEVKLVNGKKTLSFRVALPQVPGKQNVEFSAYAFNADRVKSETIRTVYKIPPALTPKSKRAYVITLGVNVNDNPKWNLRYAANDAVEIEKRLTARLREAGEYAEVIGVPLISVDEQTGSNIARRRDATKANLKTVFDLLAGRKPAGAATIPQADKIKKATPNDLVILAFASHGYTDGRGVFYLIPQDTGAAAGSGLAAVLNRCISSDELSQWLRDVDAGEMVMIVDACHSAAAVQGPGFKPGPMGSRGLGQLAYDKRMRILAATQADNIALELNNLQHGLLTYALLEDGLAKGEADYKPKDSKIELGEWLKFAEDRVPKLYEDVRAGRRTMLVNGRDSKLAGALPRQPSSIQRPSLFDFARKRDEVILVRGR